MSMWWLAMPVLLLPIWWHRQKRERSNAQPLATARFLPRADPQQQRVWRWTDRLLLLVRCLLLAGVIALLADVTLPWRGDTVLVAPGADAAWLDRQVTEAGFAGAVRITVADPLGYLALHEREWKASARLLVAGNVPMPALRPQLRHKVELRTLAAPSPAAEHRVAIVSKRAPQWRALFAALDGVQKFVVTDTPDSKSELIVWDVAEAPPAGLRVPLWWVGDASAFPELRNARSVDGLRYADSARGRLWTAAPPADAGSARSLFETWQRLHYAPAPYSAPSQTIAASTVQAAPAAGALRDILLMALAALFALERILSHASRR
ncbi:BatA domain-containing protein [Massilia sp. TWR1-2-2]|uniref:BatA domain-containing protein n=1 Tax=Massilia sp. TWR1-2-2 TaxID=2804584 RepID=UPI003CED996B